MGRGALLLSARESYDLLFLELELDMNEYLVFFPPGVGSRWGRRCSAILGVGESLNFCPFCQVCD